MVGKGKESRNYAMFKEIDMQKRKEAAGDKCLGSVLDISDSKESHCAAAGISLESIVDIEES